MLTKYYIIFSILTAGYLVLRFWNYTRYRVIRFNGQELFLASGALGTIILFGGLIIHSAFFPVLHTLHISLILTGVGDVYLHSITIGFLGCAVFIPIYNNYLGTKENTIDGIIERENDGLELMLLESLKEGVFLLFTLSNGKVYIGVVNSHFFSPYENESFQVWPFFSGYRNAEKDIELNTDYSQVYAELVENDNYDLLNRFSVTIKVEQIITCSYFDRSVYEKFSLNGEESDQTLTISSLNKEGVFQTPYSHYVMG